jgi:rare lipoprotein A
MRMREIPNKVGWRPSVQFWLLLTTVCVAAAAAFGPVPMRTVQANAANPDPSKPTVVVVPAKSPTPKFVEDLQAEAKIPANLLHGFASWYGTPFDGRQTASGETYDMYGMTACHPTLPFGTTVRVVNLRNRRSVIVRITDRGLLYNGRIMDLSYAAAMKLGMVRNGVAPVKIHILSMGQAGTSQSGIGQ